VSAAKHTPGLPFGLSHTDQLTQPFCACGRVVSMCDGSRRACRERAAIAKAKGGANG
jgi:hypothetical protein